MINIKSRIEKINELLSRGSEESITYAALECRLTIEFICYERLKLSLDVLSKNDLKKWQPKDVMKQVIEEANKDAASELTLSISSKPIDPNKTQTSAADHQAMEYVDIGTQAALDLKILGKLWNALSSTGLHVALPADKNDLLSLYGDTNKTRSKVELALNEFNKLEGGSLILGGTAEIFHFDCLVCNSTIRRNSALLKTGQIVNCSSRSCLESYIIGNEDGEHTYARNVYAVPCKYCSAISSMPKNQVKYLRPEASTEINCESCDREIKIWIMPTVKNASTE